MNQQFIHTHISLTIIHHTHISSIIVHLTHKSSNIVHHTHINFDDHTHKYSNIVLTNINKIKFTRNTSYKMATSLSPLPPFASPCVMCCLLVFRASSHVNKVISYQVLNNRKKKSLYPCCIPSNMFGASEAVATGDYGSSSRPSYSLPVRFRPLLDSIAASSHRSRLLEAP